MASLLERKLIVVAGKGGAGKSTVACALGILAARSGLRAVVAELGEQQRLPALFGVPEASEPGAEVELEEGLWSTCIDPEMALFEWLRTVSGRISARMLSASSTFNYFAAAAPGAKELMSMVKVCELCEGARARKDRDPYDLVILDAPATGHALALLHSPQTFGSIVRMGPLAEQARKARELLEDPLRSGYVAVAHANELAVAETLELEYGVRESLGRDLDAVVVNGTLPRRFTRDELRRVAALEHDHPAIESAQRAATAVHARAAIQQAQIARLRRATTNREKSLTIFSVPFVFASEFDLRIVNEIAALLRRKLSYA
ncbi:MAG TPA: ArsA-related P-loop ATPase [Solirubrobacteraceae bacterium]|jgi:anion-transporting  ArsA/GET3 family ATPase